MKFSHFGTPNGPNFEKLKGLGLSGGEFKNMKFSHFVTPNGQNFALLKN